MVRLLRFVKSGRDTSQRRGFEGKPVGDCGKDLFMDRIFRGNGLKIYASLKLYRVNVWFSFH